MDVLNRVPVSEQDPEVRAHNFSEVCLGYTAEEAQCEASRCINCKNAQCMKGCPVAINIPGFVEQVKTAILKPLIRLFPNQAHCLLSVDVYVLRRASVKVNVSVVSKEIRFPLVSWSVLLLTGQEKTGSNRLVPKN